MSDFNQEILNLLSKTNCVIYDRNKVIENFGIEFQFVNSILFTQNVHLIIIDVWSYQNESHHYAQNITEGIENSIHALKKLCKNISSSVFGINNNFPNTNANANGCEFICLYLSKYLIGTKFSKQIKYENTICSKIKIFTMFDFNPELLLYRLALLLHSINIFLYDLDGSSIML